MDIGIKVKNNRNRLGMNQKELAQLAGLTQATVSRIESGDVKKLTPATLKKLAVALGLTTDYLVGMTEDLTDDELHYPSKPDSDLVRRFRKLSTKIKLELTDFEQFLKEKESERKKGRVHNSVEETGPSGSTPPLPQ